MNATFDNNSWRVGFAVELVVLFNMVEKVASKAAILLFDLVELEVLVMFEMALDVTLVPTTKVSMGVAHIFMPYRCW